MAKGRSRAGVIDHAPGKNALETIRAVKAKLPIQTQPARPRSRSCRLSRSLEPHQALA